MRGLKLAVGFLLVARVGGANPLTSLINVLTGGPEERNSLTFGADLPLPKDRLKVADLASWLAKENISDVDTLLDRVKEKGFAENLYRFTLIHTSRSLHRAKINPLYPRVVFSYRGLTGAVTGDPADPESYEQLELIEFDDTKNDFVFYNVDFNGKQPEVPVKPVESPNACTECHGKQPRPLWAAYPVWPGSYGSRNDVLTKKEKDQFLTFRKAFANGTHERYKKFAAPRRLFTYLDPKANLKVGLELNLLNFRKAYAQLSKSKITAKYAYALIGASKGCENIPAFLPGDLAKAHERRLGMGYFDLIRATQLSVEREATARANRFNKGLAPEEKSIGADEAGLNDVERTQITSNLRYVIEGQSLAPVDMAAWALSYSPTGRSYSFSNGHQGIQDFYEFGIKPHVKNISAASLADCDWLQKASLESLK